MSTHVVEIKRLTLAPDGVQPFSLPGRQVANERLRDHVGDEGGLAEIEDGVAVLIAVVGTVVGLLIDRRFFVRPLEAVRPAPPRPLVRPPVWVAGVIFVTRAAVPVRVRAGRVRLARLLVAETGTFDDSRKIVDVQVRGYQHAADRPGGGDDFAILVA